MSKETPPHPILPDSTRWALLEFICRPGPEPSETTVDMTLARGDAVRRLRFFGVTDLELARGHMPTAAGMRILDATGRTPGTSEVRVVNGGQDRGVPTFRAAAVVDLDDHPH